MRVARYIRKGHGISHRARIAKNNDEHPMTYWIKELAIDKETLKKLLIYVGEHQTGLYAMRTGFYRMPDLKNEIEAKKFFHVYNNADPAKKKFLAQLDCYRRKNNSRKFISVDKFFEDRDQNKIQNVLTIENLNAHHHSSKSLKHFDYRDNVGRFNGT